MRDAEVGVELQIYSEDLLGMTEMVVKNKNYQYKEKSEYEIRKMVFFTEHFFKNNLVSIYYLDTFLYKILG